MIHEFYRETLVSDGNVFGACILPANDKSSELSRGFYNTMAIIPEQTHSLNVQIVENEYQRFFHSTDALVTFQRNIPIGVVTADCVPILMYASDAECIAAIHAGWRGTLGGIIDNVLDLLKSHGVSPSNLKVVFGPSISMINYEVDEDLADKFRETGFGEYVKYPGGEGSKPHIDLQGVNVARLERKGVPLKNIRLNDQCTFSTLNDDGTPKYQSHRRSGGNPGRNLTVICLEEDQPNQ